jgi:predicted type IV restriction endonuclease
MSSPGVGGEVSIMIGQSEAFSRILIDKALEYSGWNLLDSSQVVFELHTGSGRADYLLKECALCLGSKARRS